MSVKALIEVLEKGTNYREVEIDCCKKCTNSYYDYIDNHRVLICTQHIGLTREVKETCVCDKYNH